MQTLFNIRKRTEHASYEKHVDNAPKAPGASKRTKHAAKTALGFKMCNSESGPSQRKQDGKKTNPDTLTDDKKHTRHPASKFIWAETCANANRIPTPYQCETVKKIAYRSTVKIVSQKA